MSKLEVKNFVISLILVVLLVSCSNTLQEEAPSTAERNSNIEQEAASTANDSTNTPIPPSPTSTSINNPEKRDFLDFNAISGIWSGEGQDQVSDFQMKVSLYSEATEGSNIGWIRYNNPLTNCKVDWTAISAQHPIYEVHEQIGREGCLWEADVTLEYDPATDTLLYSFIGTGGLEGTGTLTRED